MHPAEINAAIKKAGTTQSAIAEVLDVTPATVSAVINNRLKSKRVQEAIANVTRSSVAVLWPEHRTQQQTKQSALQKARAAIGHSKTRKAA